MNLNGKYLQIPICGYKEECTFEELINWFELYDKYDVKELCGFVTKD